MAVQTLPAIHGLERQACHYLGRGHVTGQDSPLTGAVLNPLNQPQAAAVIPYLT